jgi:hypothetical protein
LPQLADMLPGRSALVVAGLLMSATGGARAEAEADCRPPTPTPRSSPTARPTGIGFNLGIASAVGVVGVTVTRAFFDCLRVELGGGAGWSGWQLSLMPKVGVDLSSAGVHYLVIGVGVGLTLPGYAASTFMADAHPVWVNAEIGYEARADDGFAFAIAAGVTRGLGGGRICVADCGDPSNLEDVSHFIGPQFRLQFAYWL